MIAQTQKFLVGLNASTGTLLWHLPFTTDFDQNAFTMGHPAITGRSIIVKDVDKIICWTFER